jgi:tetratricopeptide (TPR) repeat protein
MSTGNELKIKGMRLFQEKHYDQAIETFREAVTAFEGEENADQVAEMQVNLGLSLRNAKQYEDAIEEMQKGLRYFQEHGDQHREAQALANAATAYAELDEKEQAETMYRTAAQIFRELGDDDSYGETILALADMQFHSGDYVLAVSTFEEGLKHIRNKNHRQKMMKQLLIAKNRMMGGNVDMATKDDTPSTDSRRRRRRRGLGIFRRGETPEEDAE